MGVRPDLTRDGHYYADVKDFLQFDQAVPFKIDSFFYEAAMRGADGRTNSGSAQRAVRNMPDQEFETILRAGFAQELNTSTKSTTDVPYGFEEEQAEFKIGRAHV